MTEYHPVHSDLPWQEIKTRQRLSGRPVHLFEQVESTNNIALEMARAEAGAGTLVIAESQSRGRGRLGKSWLSPPGTGLYFSLILRPRLEFNEIPRLTLAMGVAVCQAISQYCALTPQLKWPNDILLNSRKCGGILAEAEFDNGQSLVVVGIGINVSTPRAAFAPELRDLATSLQDHVSYPVIRGELLTVLLSEIEQTVFKMEKGEFPAILERWQQLDTTRGKLLSWVAVSGRVVRGISLGPDKEGRLHIRDSEGKVHEILSGEVQLAAR